MLHPSYTDLMKVVNSDVEIGEEPVINSRYSIVIATAKRARQLVDGSKPLVEDAQGKKPFSIAVEELNSGAVKILSEEEAAALEAQELLSLEEGYLDEEYLEEFSEDALEEEVDGEASEEDPQ